MRNTRYDIDIRKKNPIGITFKLTMLGSSILSGISISTFKWFKSKLNFMLAEVDDHMEHLLNQINANFNKLIRVIQSINKLNIHMAC